MKFTYASGDKPLEGYTIKRGIGRGGFGEVYFGVSERGKEVAMKLIQDNLAVELRGIEQCLNLKHPNLVHLYDLRTDAHGDHWLVMEHVAGEPLGAILARHPHGVSPELAGQWFVGLAGAIHHLHDHGIVHRDLKPGNIFLENGFIKVGDYGLCKTMAGSQHQKQTQSVGTVHYMAPEVASGNYKHQVDIYAAGIILYEMLTGHVPFDGESAVEILFKHQTERPDLTKVPMAFVPILDKALCKNPAGRYQSIGDMSKQVEAVIEANAAPVPVAERNLSVHSLPRVDMPTQVYWNPRKRLGDASLMLLAATLLAAGCTLCTGIITRPAEWQDLVPIFYLTTLGCAAVLVPAVFWTKPMEESWPRRLTLTALGLGIGMAALWLDGFELPLPWIDPSRVDSLRPFAGSSNPQRVWGLYQGENRALPVLFGYLGYFGLMFMALRWWKASEETRRRRFSFSVVIATAFWAYLLLFLMPAAAQRREAFVSLVLTSIIVQLVSPWRPRDPLPGKRWRLRRA